MDNKEIKELLEWTPEGVDLKAIGKINYPPKYFPKKEYGEIVTDEDCKCPFFCESYLYALLETASDKIDDLTPKQGEVIEIDITSGMESGMYEFEPPKKLKPTASIRN